MQRFFVPIDAGHAGSGAEASAESAAAFCATVIHTDKLNRHHDVARSLTAWWFALAANFWHTARHRLNDDG